MGPPVNTVLGTCRPEDLGVTLVHEHLLCGLPGWQFDAAAPTFDREKAIETAVACMRELGSHGVDTIVDPCPADFGRDMAFAADVARKSGMRIVCSSGLFAPSHYYEQLSVEQIAAIYVEEITRGVGEAGVKTGVLKAAAQSPTTAIEEKNLRAVGRAARETGLPVITHTVDASEGHRQLDVLQEEGVRPARVVIGHSDGRADLAYLVSLMDRGAFIGLDRWGLEVHVSDKLRLACLIGLVGIGYADRVLLSHDSVCCWLGRPLLDLPEDSSLYANWRPTHLFRNIIPQLGAAGIGEGIVRRMLVDNPRRLFEME